VVAVCKVTETELVKLPPLGLIVGVAAVVTVGELTVRLNVVVFVTPPPAAVRVMVELPAGVEPLVLIVSVEEQVGLQLAAENEAVAPDGRPEVKKEIASGTPELRVAVRVFVTDCP
jgi:hypothetical protein